MKNNQIIKIFEKIRDLPYEIGPHYEGEKLIEYGRGGCGSKNRYLANWFYLKDYKIKVCTTPYKWADLKFLPNEPKNHPKAQKIGNHVYLKVLIENNWVLVDTSWDKHLSTIFPVNLNWDGKSNQISATKITKEKCMAYPEPYLSNRQKIQKSSVLDELDIDFSKKMNEYFDKIRNQQ